MKRVLVLLAFVAMAAPLAAQSAPTVPLKNAPTALGPVYAIWQATWAKVGNNYSAIPRANPRPPNPCPPQQCIPLGLASAQASSCDSSYGPPTADSCHGWWTQRQDVWEGGSCGWNECFRTYWRIVFWTNQDNTAVTHASTYCESTDGYFSVENPCTSGVAGGGGYSVPWNVDWWFHRYPFNICNKYTGEAHAHIYVRASVNAKHQVQGTSYRNEYWEYPNYTC